MYATINFASNNYGNRGKLLVYDRISFAKVSYV